MHHAQHPRETECKLPSSITVCRSLQIFHEESITYEIFSTIFVRLCLLTELPQVLAALRGHTYVKLQLGLFTGDVPQTVMIWVKYAHNYVLQLQAMD